VLGRSGPRVDDLSVEAASLTVAPSSAEWLRLAQRARLLSWLSLGLIGAEGAVAIAAGIAAGSIALIGFGIDSVIEGLASVVIVWRFSGWRLGSAVAELRAQRLVALQFFLLAPYVAAESLHALLAGERPDPSWVGIGLAMTSLAVMPTLGVMKQRLAERLRSAATRGEGRQNMLCGYLAGALLVGLLGNALLGAWWLDPAVGLAIAVVAIAEGRRAWRGESCCS
jgi:divalent metal cation (Fe/Co/Zn/Cd) transporter